MRKRKLSGQRLLILRVATAFLAVFLGLGLILNALPVYADGDEGAPPADPGSTVGDGQTDGGDQTGGGAIVWTDLPDYAPTETPVFTGSGFAANSEVTVTVTAPDGTTTTFTATTDDQGQFAADYTGLLGPGMFTVSVTEGVNTATTTFTDVWSHKTITVNDNLPGSLDADFTVDYTTWAGPQTTITDTNWSQDVSTGSTVTVSDPQATVTDIGNGVKYAFSSYSQNDVTMNSNQIITLNYSVFQYYLDINDGPGTSTGEGWYNVGADAEFSIVSTEVEDGGVRYEFNGWIGSGSGHYDGGDVTHIVTMNNHIHETAQWDETAYLLTIKTSGIDYASYYTNVYLGGSPAGTANDGSSFTQWFDAGDPTGTIGVNNFISFPFTDYTFWGWWGGGPNPKGSVTMNQPRTYTAYFNSPPFEITGIYSSDALGVEDSEFYPTEGVYAHITTWGGSGDESPIHVHIFVTADKTVWLLNDPLTDVSSEGFDGVNVPFGGGTWLVWPADTTLGNYDIVADVNHNGKYGCEPEENPDKVDDMEPTGFTVVAPRPEEYYLWVTSPYGLPALGEGTYPADSGAYAGLTDGIFWVGPPGQRWVFNNWSVDATGNNYALSDQIIMDGDKTAVADWVFVADPLGDLGIPAAVIFTWFGNPGDIPLDPQGRTEGPVEIEGANPDDPVLILEPGTAILGLGGVIPRYVEGIPGGTPPPPEGTTIIDAYQFLPSGITFDPAAKVVINYNPEDVPAGSVLVIAYYDEVAGQWVEVETAGYVLGGEEVPNAVTCDITHFTYFALLAK